MTAGRVSSRQRSPVHVLRQVAQTVVAQVQQLQPLHPQGADGDGDEPVLRYVQVHQPLQAAQLPAVTPSVSAEFFRRRTSCQIFFFIFFLIFCPSLFNIYVYLYIYTYIY